jgi:hypothetical protein
MDVMKKTQARTTPPQWRKEWEAVHDFDKKFPLSQSASFSNNARRPKVLPKLRT